MHNSSIKQSGLTIVELLVVISVIGILAGVTIRIINVRRQQEIAMDATRRQNLRDTADAIETYFAAERSYPDDGSFNNPLDASATTADVASLYIDSWPNGMVYNLSGGVFSVHVRRVLTNGFFKYNSSWRTIRECGSTTSELDVADCD